MRKNICLCQSAIEASPSISAQTRYPVLFAFHVTSCLEGMEKQETIALLLSSFSSRCLLHVSDMRRRWRHVFYFIESMVNTYTTVYAALLCSEWKRGRGGRVGLMALVLRAPVPTRGWRSLEHRYSQLFPTSLLGCGNTGWSASSYDNFILLFNRPRRDRTCDGQTGWAKKKKRKRKKK